MVDEQAAHEGTTPDDGVLWVQPSGRSVDDLVAQVKALQHRVLLDADRIIGLAAERDTLRAEVERMADTELAVAFARVDQLEDEREGLVHEVHKLLRDHRLALELRDARTRTEVDQILASTTWKLGSAVIKPISGIRSVVRRS
ncbi:hypothetical protein [Plantibacter cousiniae (nom. nud.)]|uniref:hypothetical protein n=1 Tax=Plantibacter cousiniae (nom. nud.) TaxID=199709 RepID=UPI001D1C9550|nr:hypothetical protein [Plantibacter cousiniae]CAH0159040.1 hypothetical protein SRABI02_00960 [Plantibacter cousiniae]